MGQRPGLERRRARGSTIALKLERSGPWIGVTGTVLMLWVTIASIRFAPWWGVTLYLLAWLFFVVLVVGWVRTRPKQSAYLPFANFGVWLGISALGAWVWNWGG